MSGQTLEQLLVERRDAIIARFVAEVRRKDLSPPGLSRSLLVDHIPSFLDEIFVELVDGREPRTSFDVIGTSITARRHGGQRWSVGYDLEALMREYGILRHCILEEATQSEIEIGIKEFDTLAKCLNVGATEAVAAYVRHRDEELAFLAEAGALLSSSLDRMSILARLTRLVVPRSADWCAVHVVGVEDTPVAHVDPEKVAPLRELHRRFSLAATMAGPYGRVLRSGEPELVDEAGEELVASLAEDPEARHLLDEVGARSWMILPVRGKDTTTGVMMLAYGSPERRYSRAELPAMQELAAKAAVALENAHLYELSQLARSRVEAATRAKDEFVAMVSHELRTPLNAILGWLRLHRSGALPVAKRAHAFDVVERNANALSALVADLLDVSRIITGAIHLDPALVDLSNVVELALDGVRPALEAKRIELALNLEPNATIRADAERLQQVVWNLLSNAIKFTPKRGRIDVTVRRVDSDVELEVRDTGLGISPDFLPHVFDSFRQWESGSTRRHGGLGIGLSIAQHIVELHGGSIVAFSDGADKGSTFVVRIPVSAVSASPGRTAASVPAAAPQRLSLPGGLEGLRVLVIDDEEDARELLRVLLEFSGIEVRTADSAERGILALEEHVPDVVVSDVAMPGEDGYSLIRRIRTLASNAARTPAIALSAYARAEDRKRALVEGFNVHLSKPVEPAELLTAIADLAGRPQTPRTTRK